MRTALFACFAAATSAPMLLAAPARAETLEIQDFIGRLEVVTGDYPRMEAEIVEGDAIRAPRLERRGDTIEIDGRAEREMVMCRGGDDGDPLQIRLGRRGEWRDLDEFPLIRVTAPRDMNLVARNAHLHGDVGDLGSAEIGMNGCGELRMENVAGTLTTRMGGSGSVDARDVAGDLTADVAGSGDVSVASVGGALDADIAGSGNVSVGSVRDGAAVNIAGSGNIRIGRAEGRIDGRIAGSGNVWIDGGHVETIELSIMDSGEVTYRGDADRADINVMGSGDVEIAQAGNADVNVAGSGNVRVNGVRVR